MISRLVQLTECLHLDGSDLGLGRLQRFRHALLADVDKVERVVLQPTEGQRSVSSCPQAPPHSPPRRGSGTRAMPPSPGLWSVLRELHLVMANLMAIGGVQAEPDALRAGVKGAYALHASGRGNLRHVKVLRR